MVRSDVATYPPDEIPRVRHSLIPRIKPEAPPDTAAQRNEEKCNTWRVLREFSDARNRTERTAKLLCTFCTKTAKTTVSK